MKKKSVENEEIVKNIIEGIQEKKGKEIVVVDLNKLSDAPCSYFVICQGDSSTQVNAVAISIKDYVNEKIKVKPYATDGFENCQWIAMDYGQIIVHIFQRPFREFYDLEHLWEDADLKRIPDLD
ncbi:Ribosomal silencing factor RsfS [uncultured Paludibacter sp.]|uniref:Ribosomal silencing factor RsfS n=1 Tax=uncultured Paludibacter sp. TaxID=497635 RepID=A0A653AJQ0_9BACT|nr:Ribosomal silencing factor RsfS [uncultured Paludibacter sp.]